MNRKKVNIINTELPKKGAFIINTEHNFPKLHTLMVVSGKRGGGKSVAVSKFIKECKKKHYYDRVYLISPTYNSNKQIWDICDIKEDDVFEPELGIIKVIKEKIEEEKLEWDTFLEEKKLYQKFKKELKDKPIEFIDDENLIKYLELGFLDKKEPPEWKYEVEQPPRIGVIFDDCINTEVMARRSSGLTNFL